MKKLQLLFRYLLYYFRSTNEHGVHSPFVYDLVTTVIYDEKEFYCFSKIEKIREKMLANHSLIFMQDFGAGSLRVNNSKRKISELAMHSAKPKKYGRLLFRLVNKFQPSTILELGTSLGLSGMYMASAHKQAQFISLEGSTELARIAQQNFNALMLSNVEVLPGTFEENLSHSIQKLEKLHFVFFDGNHRRIPTIAYFEECLKFCCNETVFVFDDIHWSIEMEEAWTCIKQHPQVKVTIDLFFVGIVFFRKEQVKENFTIRY
ncbi:MAG: class I SAM-dependent methyltransferase [Bacteroidetes bacterium]|nr:class I SAM-dependent methyltransferase [Bacteroidota bacterium]